MWTITKEFKFEAAHKLPYHDGKCRRLHGHSFVGRVTCRSPELQKDGPQRGMVVDFSRVKEALTPIVEEKLDHFYLNESTGLESPTSEALCKWVFDQLKLTGIGNYVVAVSIDETCTSTAEYRPDA